jgi:hypothetical protein
VTGAPRSSAARAAIAARMKAYWREDGDARNRATIEQGNARISPHAPAIRAGSSRSLTLCEYDAIVKMVEYRNVVHAMP